jgi:hypothetical protein
MGRATIGQPTEDPGLQRALALLLQAFTHAESEQQSPRQFAVA